MYLAGTKTYSELQEWARMGLISHFDGHTFQDDVYVEVLKAIREYIVNNNPDGHSNEVSHAE